MIAQRLERRKVNPQRWPIRALRRFPEVKGSIPNVGLGTHGRFRYRKYRAFGRGRQVGTLAGPANTLGISMEAKVNMSARIAKANREWVKAQAYSRHLTMSQVVDVLIEEARKASYSRHSGDPGHKAS